MASAYKAKKLMKSETTVLKFEIRSHRSVTSDWYVLLRSFDVFGEMIHDVSRRLIVSDHVDFTVFSDRLRYAELLRLLPHDLREVTRIRLEARIVERVALNFVVPHRRHPFPRRLFPVDHAQILTHTAVVTVLEFSRLGEMIRPVASESLAFV